jgi:hypothetical protein
MLRSRRPRPTKQSEAGVDVSALPARNELSRCRDREPLGSRGGSTSCHGVVTLYDPASCHPEPTDRQNAAAVAKLNRYGSDSRTVSTDFTLSSTRTS